MQSLDLKGSIDDTVMPLPPRLANMLDDLQPNIVRPHIRDHSHLFFIRFVDAGKGCDFIHDVRGKMKSATKHFTEVNDFKARRVVTTSPLLSLHLSACGYKALGRADIMPDGPAFRAGMKARADTLADPDSDSWDHAYRREVHAMIIVGGATSPAAMRDTDDLAGEILELMVGRAELTGVPETGIGMNSLKAKGEGIEHFGYVDGRSQPLFLKTSLDEEKDKNADSIPASAGPHGFWSPDFPLNQILVPDKGGVAGVSHGSFFVYRKLEQNVHGFKSREEELANAMNFVGGERERAGASVVGRFEDGTPYTLQSSDGLNDPVPNDFNYEHDSNALKCPFHAHIRKTNPRGDVVRQFAAPELAERRPIMARRGVTYGARALHPNDPTLELADMPTGGVGLLFMAFQSSIEEQFEFTQQSWANEANFVRRPTGIDPVIGQGGAGGQTHSPGWNDATATSEALDIANFVTMRGGEYFFTPSLTTLETI